MSTSTGRSAGSGSAQGRAAFSAPGAMRTLMLPVATDSFAYVAGPIAYSTSQDGGESLFSPGFEGTPDRATVRFTCSQAELAYLGAFYRLATLRGSVPFVLQVVRDGPVWTLHKSWIVPKTLTIQSSTLFDTTVEVDVLVDPAEYGS